MLKYFTDRHDKNYYDNDNIKTILYELNICKAKLEHDHIKNNISDNDYNITNDIFLSIEYYFNNKSSKLQYELKKAIYSPDN